MKKLNKNLVVIISAFVLMFGFTSPNTLLAAGPAMINLYGAENFAILAKTGISTTGSTLVNGNIGISPAAATFITGFGLSLSAESAYATSSLVVGQVYAPGYANPTPTNISNAISNMETAYTDGAGRTNPTATELGAGNIGGMTLAPGLYKWSTGVIIPTNVTLSGGVNDVWIFQIAQNLNVSPATNIILSGGAQANNVFWVVAGQTTIGTTAVFNGNILDQTAIVLNTGAVLNGRALAQSAVTLDANAVTKPLGIIWVTTPPVNSSTTATIAQSNTPVTTTYSSGNTQTTNSTGCSGGNKFNTSTGLPCVNNTVNTYNFGTTTLKNGSRGNAVMELQRFLNAKLNLGLVLDGKLGPKTITVIKKWQKDNGLVSDGLVGAKTKMKMNAQAN